MTLNMSKVLRVLNIDEELLIALDSFSDVTGWDSIMQMQLVVIVESDLHVELSAEEIQNLTPQNLAELYKK